MPGDGLEEESDADAAKATQPWYWNGPGSKIVVGVSVTVIGAFIVWIGSTLLTVPEVQSETSVNSDQIEDLEREVEDLETTVKDEAIPLLRNIERRTRKLDDEKGESDDEGGS